MYPATEGERRHPTVPSSVPAAGDADPWKAIDGVSLDELMLTQLPIAEKVPIEYVEAWGAAVDRHAAAMVKWASSGARGEEAELDLLRALKWLTFDFLISLFGVWLSESVQLRGGPGAARPTPLTARWWSHSVSYCTTAPHAAAGRRACAGSWRTRTPPLLLRMVLWRSASRAWCTHSGRLSRCLGALSVQWTNGVHQPSRPPSVCPPARRARRPHRVVRAPLLLS